MILPVMEEYHKTANPLKIFGIFTPFLPVGDRYSVIVSFNRN